MTGNTVNKCITNKEKEKEEFPNWMAVSGSVPRWLYVSNWVLLCLRIIRKHFLVLVL